MTARDPQRDPQDADFEDFWETLGLDDTKVEAPRTVTMRPPTRLEEGEDERDIPALPRLIAEGSRQTLPEIRFKDTLGEGGMGLVSLATQVPLGRDVAVKGLKDGARNQQMRLALLREGWMTGLPGAILHEVLTGQPAHQGTSLFQIMFRAYNSEPYDYDESVPAPLADICRKAMAPAPDERFGSSRTIQRHATASRAYWR